MRFCGRPASIAGSGFHKSRRRAPFALYSGCPNAIGSHLGQTRRTQGGAVCVQSPGKRRLRPHKAGVLGSDVRKRARATEPRRNRRRRRTRFRRLSAVQATPHRIAKPWSVIFMVFLGRLQILLQPQNVEVENETVHLPAECQGSSIGREGWPIVAQRKVGFHGGFGVKRSQPAKFACPFGDCPNAARLLG